MQIGFRLHDIISMLFQVNIEKAYAFAEFITPEDATTALGFDGITLHGTILKIRRPKDFIAPEVVDNNPSNNP